MPWAADEVFKTSEYTAIPCVVRRPWPFPRGLTPAPSRVTTAACLALTVLVLCAVVTLRPFQLPVQLEVRYEDQGVSFNVDAVKVTKPFEPPRGERGGPSKSSPDGFTKDAVLQC